jgi:hypothetical protein
VSWRTICAIAAGALLLAGRGGTDAAGRRACEGRPAGIGPGCTWKATGADASDGVLLNQPTDQGPGCAARQAAGGCRGLARLCPGTTA